MIVWKNVKGSVLEEMFADRINRFQTYLKEEIDNWPVIIRSNDQSVPA